MSYLSLPFIHIIYYVTFPLIYLFHSSIIGFTPHFSIYFSCVAITDLHISDIDKPHTYIDLLLSLGQLYHRFKSSH